MTTKIKDSSRRRKAMAVIAAGVVIGVGATVTLATWNDSEWVTGGASSDSPFVGTSNFSIQQNTDGVWNDQPSQPGGLLNFTPASLLLSPGAAVYAPVSLSTRAPVGDVAGSVGTNNLLLAGAIQATPVPAWTAPPTATPAPAITGEIPESDEGLWAEVELRVVVTYSTSRGSGPTACDLSTFTDPEAVFVVGTAAEGAVISTDGEGVTALLADGEDMQNYCFQISLPATAPSSLQGLTISPAWQFTAESE